MTRKNEPRLKSNDIEQLSDHEFIKFIIGRDSLFRDYKLLHNLEIEEARSRINSVIHSNSIKELCKEFRICFKAATQTEARQTYYFNLFIIDLIERYFSDFIFNQNKKEINMEEIPAEDDTSLISDEWVLYSRILNPYQRYLLFEYLALGYSLEALAKRRYCTVRTIENHLKILVDLIGS